MEQPTVEALPDLARLTQMAARFAPVDIRADVASLPASERAALARLVDAARHIDALFLRQVWPGNAPLLLSLLADESPLGQARLRYFLANKGPWSRLDDNRPFVPGVPAEKPGGAGFYPADAGRADVERWLAGLPDDQQTGARGFFTAIRRTPPGAASPFQAVPYNLEYQPELLELSRLLNEAAALTAQPSLRTYLTARAAAFLSNDYYASDVAWMELDATIEPTIGPYEVYEDEWFNYKAAFEAVITLRDAAETARLARFGGELQDLEDHLPIDPAYRNRAVGTLVPIRVVNVVVTAGDANRGVQTAAFNLPNDERVLREKGSKSVMLRNVQQAKFSQVLQPIAAVALAREDRERVSFEAFFTHILLHELMHGLGPHDIDVDGRRTTVRQALRETYSPVEEAKADISSLWAVGYLIDKGVIEREIGDSLYHTFLASAFRSIRFGITEAHGRGVAMQLNYLLDAGGVRVREDGTFAVVADRFAAACAALTGEIMTLQARGDRRGAAALVASLGVIRPEVQRVLERLRDVPVDIAPRFAPVDA
jgi:hypothetical protein